MKTMTYPNQQLDAAAKRSGRVRATKASVSEPLLARESRQPAANDSRTPLALLTDLHQSTSAAIDAAGRHSLIAESAYLRAERRGFNGGCAITDWLEAEREVDGQLSGREAPGARCGG